MATSTARSRVGYQRIGTLARASQDASGEIAGLITGDERWRADGHLVPDTCAPVKSGNERQLAWARCSIPAALACPVGGVA